MTCVYQRNRSDNELKKLLKVKEIPLGLPEEAYFPSDVVMMCKTIAETDKTCFAFKVLAAGRVCKESEEVYGNSDGVYESIRFVLEHIKPKDAIIVGMYPRYKDQIEENAEIVADICNNKKSK